MFYFFYWLTINWKLEKIWKKGSFLDNFSKLSSSINCTQYYSPLDKHWNVGSTMSKQFYPLSFPKYIISITFHIRGNNVYIPYSKAKKYVKKINIKNFREYRKWSKSGNRPKSIPSNPDRVYKKNWKGWKKFLGNK